MNIFFLSILILVRVIIIFSFFFFISISFGGEYAFEMILKSARLGLKMTEIPVSLSPDQHNRIPYLNPWLAGWMNLRLIFLLALFKKKTVQYQQRRHKQVKYKQQVE